MRYIDTNPTTTLLFERIEQTINKELPIILDEDAFKDAIEKTCEVVHDIICDYHIGDDVDATAGNCAEAARDSVNTWDIAEFFDDSILDGYKDMIYETVLDAFDDDEETACAAAGTTAEAVPF